MVNLVGNMTTNLLNADLYSRCTNTALGVYAVAKAKGDTATMERAIGYAGDVNATANEAAGKIDDDIRDALKKARAEEKEKTQKEREAREIEAEREKTEDVTGDDQDSIIQKNNEIPGTDIVKTDLPSPSSLYSLDGMAESAVPSGAVIDIQV